MAELIRLNRYQLAEFIDDPDVVRQFEKIVKAINLGLFSVLEVGMSPDFFIVEPDGTWVNEGDSTTWDEISNSFIGEKLTSPASDIRTNVSEITLDFETSARYPADFVSSVIQSPHARKTGSDFKPHFHWIQNEDAIPNILVEYRIYNNGETVPAVWALKAVTRNVFPYTSGSILQISPFDLPDGFAADSTVSSTFDCRVYRDVTNASGLFAGADAYTGDWMVKYYDIHFERDMNGSREEFIK